MPKNWATRRSVGLAIAVGALVLVLWFAGSLYARRPQDDMEKKETHQPIIPATSVLSVPTATAWMTSAPSPLFSGTEAMQFVEAQMAFGARPTGSDASRQTGDYILEKLVVAGWNVDVQTFTYQGIQGRNLIGRSTGDSDKPVFLLGAHYDTRRLADRDLVSQNLPVPGANDGASGVAVLLELARVLDLSKVDGEVWLVFFDAEDDGGLDGWDWIVGSRYFVGYLATSVAYAIVVDMIGDSDQNIYFENNSDPLLRARLWGIAADLGYSSYIIPETRYSMLDDHTAFLEKGIPAVDMIDFDYPFWHTSEDTADKVSAASLEHVGRVLEYFLESGGGYPFPQ